MHQPIPAVNIRSPPPPPSSDSHILLAGTREACLSGMRNGMEDLKHFLPGCKKPSQKRTQFIVTLNNVTKNIFDSLNTDTKMRKIVNLDFEDQKKINMVGKAPFGLYRERERMEENDNQEVGTTYEPCDPNVSTG